MGRRPNIDYSIDLIDGHLVANPKWSSSYAFTKFARNHDINVYKDVENTSRGEGIFSEYVLRNGRKFKFAVDKKGRFKFYSKKHVEQYDPCTINMYKARGYSGYNNIDEDGVKFDGHSDIHHEHYNKIESKLVDFWE